MLLSGGRDNAPTTAMQKKKRKGRKGEMLSFKAVRVYTVPKKNGRPDKAWPPDFSRCTWILLVAGHVVVRVVRCACRRRRITVAAARGVRHAHRRNIPAVETDGLRVDVARRGPDEIAGGA